MLQNIVITGCNGFIGKILCERLSREYRIIGIDSKRSFEQSSTFIFEKADITVPTEIKSVINRYIPDIVIHCAGIAHQKLGTVDSVSYFEVNSDATENIAKISAELNPTVRLFFLSSISVYGEGPHIRPQVVRIKQFSQAGQIKNTTEGVSEDSNCQPSSDYAFSKLEAEKRLLALVDKGILRHLVILRLAPVYDLEWSLNLDRRVLAPKKIAYFKFGNGQQEMSALARSNLVEFIRFFLLRSQKSESVDIMNICDAEPYEFNEIIQVFKKSNLHPNRPILRMPLSFVWLATRIFGLFCGSKKKWIYSAYDKLASSLVFDNTKMLETGFKPQHSLQTIFDPQITQIHPPQAD